MNQIRIHNLSTDKIIDRDMTKKELETAEALSSQSLAAIEAFAEKAQAKADLLKRLGITEDEAKLLLS